MKSIFWIMGMSGSGKSTLSNIVLNHFKDKLIFLDNDKFRAKISNSFEKKTRIYTVDLLREKVKDMAQDTNVLVNKITPYEIEMRQKNRNELLNYYEIWCNCPVEVLIERDVKGLYKKAQQGLVEHMIGISTDKDDIYEEPKNADLILDTTKSIEECSKILIDFVGERLL